MRHITKGPQPNALIQWKFTNRLVPENLRYGVASFPHADVVEALLGEQGGLCAYTMQRVNTLSAHVEHIKPQHICQKEDEARSKIGQPPAREDIDWSNLLACFPAPGRSAEYGAKAKDGWWDQNLFVSPLNATCANRFVYQMNGSVEVRNPADNAALETKKRLKLNHESLKELRVRAYQSLGIHPRSNKPMGIIQAQNLVNAYSAATPPNLPEFVVAVIHVAQEYISWQGKIMARRKYAAKA